jgi:metallo-beta-lactamase class B
MVLQLSSVWIGNADFGEDVGMFRLVLILAFTALAPLAQSSAKIPINSNLELVPVGDGAFVVRQISTPYQANGLLVQIGNDFVIVDAKNNDDDAQNLLTWIKARSGSASPRITVINSHFHNDATGWNKALKDAGATVIASTLTNELLKDEGMPERQPTQTYTLAAPPKLEIGGETIEIIYPGASHSRDDVVVYFPKRKLLFGSCMSKSGDDLGNLTDADITSWRQAMDRLKQIPAATIVPGHGDDYSPSIIDNTIRLLDEALKQGMLGSKGH